MNSRRRSFALGGVAICLVAAGCASQPTAQELANADYGPYPENYVQLIESFYQRTLKDPSSMQLQGGIPAPTTAWIKQFGDFETGYKTCVRVNAKNSFGAYVGFQTDFFLINNGRIIRYIDKADRLDMTTGSHLCS